MSVVQFNWGFALLDHRSSVNIYTMIKLLKLKLYTLHFRSKEHKKALWQIPELSNNSEGQGTCAKVLFPFTA